jgi:sugar/nucleoside kinase (ribokinase family)
MKDLNRIINYFQNKKGKITLGIDGFVDDVWQIVSVRTSPTDYSLYEKMQDFAKSVYNVGAGGYANEIIRKRRSHGGFTAHSGEAADNLGMDVTLVGMFDKEGGGGIDPIYQTFSKNCKVYSVGTTAICPTFEFSDGKILLPYVAGIAGLSWKQLTDALTKDELESAYGNATVMGLGYWSLLDNFDDLIVKLCENYMKAGARLFFDFADIRKRDKQALMNTLKLLSELDKTNPVTLSLNEHECGILFSHFGREFDWKKPELANRDIEYVRNQIGFDEIIVHTPYFAAGASATEGVEVVLQRYCDNPVVTTGAGDNFNGGYMCAIADKGGLNFAERLLVGNAVSGYYIRNGASPTLDGLKSELEKF